MSEHHTDMLGAHLEEQVAIDLKESTFYPLIKSGYWIGLARGAVHSILIGSEESPLVVVGFCYGTADNLIFLNEKDSKEIDLNAAVEQAFANIDAIDITLEPIEALDNQVLTASGDFFSSEAILAHTQMLKAHKLLNAERLLVSIVRRTTLMIISQDAPKELFDKFVQLHNYTLKDDNFGNGVITNDLFVIEKGEIVGSIRLHS